MIICDHCKATVRPDQRLELLAVPATDAKPIKLGAIDLCEACFKQFQRDLAGVVALLKRGKPEAPKPEAPPTEEQQARANGYTLDEFRKVKAAMAEADARAKRGAVGLKPDTDGEQLLAEIVSK